MPRMSGGQAVVKALRTQGVSVLFALPGVQNDPLFNALYDEGDAIRVIHPRHEQGAAFMAYGYAQSTGRVVLGAGAVPADGIADALEGRVEELYRVGDCTAPARVLDAMHEGAISAYRI